MHASKSISLHRPEEEPGGLLDELERRQDSVLDQLDDLDAKLNEVLKGLEPEKAETKESERDEHSLRGPSEYAPSLRNAAEDLAEAEDSPENWA